MGKLIQRRAQELEDRRKRSRLRKDWKVAGLPPKVRAATNRAIKNIIRKNRSYLFGQRPLSKSDLVLLMRKRRESKLLNHLYPERLSQGGWLSLQHRSAPKDKDGDSISLNEFSFLDRPKETLEGLKKIAQAEASSAKVRIDFEDRFCLDVAPFMLLVECWNEMLPVFEGGRMEVPMQKVLASVGIEYALGVGFAGVEDFDDVWAFPLTRRRGSGASKSRQRYIDVQTREEATDRFCDAMNEWLARPELGLELSQQGIGWIKQLMGEVLENAERHSDGDRRDGSWSVSGFLAKRGDKEHEAFVAQLSIVSLGDTFSESLSRASESQQENINVYLSNQKAEGAPQSVETLRTVAALQDGVTCAAEADAGNRGGTGLMEMLDLVNALGGTNDPKLQPKVTIISGRSCIQLRPPYLSGNQKTGPNGARVQWCNESNSANVAPDQAFVYDLGVGVPGTVISMRFTLDPDYLKRVAAGGENHAD